MMDYTGPKINSRLDPMLEFRPTRKLRRMRPTRMGSESTRAEHNGIQSVALSSVDRRGVVANVVSHIWGLSSRNFRP